MAAKEEQRGPRVAIREIEIENFRGIEHLSLSFATPGGDASDIAVLAGPNGSGKTTVLEACLLALGRGRLIPEGDERRWIRSGCTSYLIRGVLDGPEGRISVERRPGQSLWA